MEKEVIGRILESTIHNARCEFSLGAQAGDPVTVKVGDTEFKARIDQLETTPLLGLQGWIIFLERPPRPPRAMATVHRGVVDMGGILFFGHDYRGNEVRFNVNPLFNHLLLVGMTQRGKTHGMLVLLEELTETGVPCIVFDTQGEFINLPEARKNSIVVEDINIMDLIAHLQMKRTIVINMLGLTNSVKASKFAALLTQFTVEKERDYAQAGNSDQLLKIPPTLIFVDEAEIYAPKVGVRSKRYGASAEAMTELAMRGSKLGMGLVASVQRVNSLAIDVRDNCNSVAAFRVIGRSNRMALACMAFFNTATLDRLKGLMKGECLVLGPLAGGSQTVKVRDIETRRAKNVNFEEMLGIVDGEATEFKPSIVLAEDGSIVDRFTSKVLATKTSRILDEDKRMFEATEGDGVLIRTEQLPDEILEEIRLQGKISELQGSGLSFETHISDEEQSILKKLREGDDRKIG